MTASTTYAADQGRGRERQDKPFPGYERSRKPARSERTGCETHDLVAAVVACARGVSGIGALNHGRHAPINSQIRRPLSADGVGGLTDLPPGMGFRRRKFSGPLARWSFPLRFQPAKQSRCGLSNRLRSFSSLLIHDRNLAWESKHEVHRKSASGAQSSE